jgi:subtilisin family serine protease
MRALRSAGTGLAQTLCIVLLVLAFLDGTARAADDSSASAAPLPTLEALIASAHAQGAVRVIVKVRAPGIAPESLAGDRFQRLLRRFHISDRQDAAVAGLAGTAHRVVRRYATSPYLAVEVSPEALRRLAGSGDVESVAPDLEVHAHLYETTALIQSQTTAAKGLTGAGHAIAVVDSGVDATHPFFGGRVVDEWCFSYASDCPNAESTQTGPGAARPSHYHGTHVAGIASGQGASFSGVAPGTSIIAMRVLRADGSGQFSDLKAALDELILLRDTRNLAAVNLSLGTDPVSVAGCTSIEANYGLQADIEALRAEGVATVVAGGNEYAPWDISYPACLPNTIKVVASTDGDQIAPFSNRSPALEATTLVAPGTAVCSAVPAGTTQSCSNAGGNGGFALAQGTSMAAPHVAGAWAVLKQVKPDATVEEVLEALRSTAVTIADPATGTSYRRIQVHEAVAALTNVTVSLSADKTAPQPAFSRVLFTATATGGVAPVQYKWWIFDGYTWKVGREWSPDASFAWSPATPCGDYKVGVWVKSGTLPGDRPESDEAIATMSFPIGAPNLKLVALTADRAPPGAPATTITFTASATGGTASYQYRWWLFDGTSWTAVSAWSTSKTFSWTPTIRNASYRIGVWVKSATNYSDSFDCSQATGSIPYPIVGPDPPPLTLLSVTSDKPAPQVAGVPITFTATARDGTPPYQYKWWLFDGVKWNAASNWSAGNSFVWAPGTPNAKYQVGVWVRSATNATDSADRPESRGTVSFPITTSTLTLQNVTPSVAAPQPAGTTIAFTATATGGIAPYQYKWWLFDGATWSLVRDWSPGNTFQWTPGVPNANSGLAYG